MFSLMQFYEVILVLSLIDIHFIIFKEKVTKKSSFSVLATVPYTPLSAISSDFGGSKRKKLKKQLILIREKGMKGTEGRKERGLIFHVSFH